MPACSKNIVTALHIQKNTFSLEVCMILCLGYFVVSVVIVVLVLSSLIIAG